MLVFYSFYCKITYCNIMHFVGYGIIKKVYQGSALNIITYVTKNSKGDKGRKTGIPLQNVGSRPLQDGNVRNSGGN
jgi:hypothetical protein